MVHNVGMAGPPKQRRSEATRERLVTAAIETFGADGFTRTSTRTVVERAGANLVSIHYHFGGKEQLYCAAAEHIAKHIHDRSAAVLERGRALARDRSASRDALIEGVCAIYDEFTGIFLAGGLPEGWRQFLVREQMEPSGTNAFRSLFGVIRPFFECVSTLIGRLQKRRPTDQRVQLTTAFIFGHVYVFRTNPHGALRMLGWTTFGPRELAAIRTTAREHIGRMLGAVPPPASVARGRRSAERR